MGFILSTVLKAMVAPAVASAPVPWQIGFQPAASPIMEGIDAMHNLLLVVISCVGLLVICLLAFVILRFRSSRNPTPSQVSHNAFIEVVWTLVPVLILVMVGVPSVKLLYFSERIVNADLTIKAIGHQWFWTYEYPDDKKPVKFDSYMIEGADLKPGQLRLLEVDNRVVVPIGKTVRLLVTSEDVLHSFAVPSLGVKKDAVPGRINETWFSIAKPGVYYGQCSELCGVKHGFMPIAIEAVPEADYQKWLASKQG